LNSLQQIRLTNVIIPMDNIDGLQIIQFHPGGEILIAFNSEGEKAHAACSNAGGGPRLQRPDRSRGQWRLQSENPGLTNKDAMRFL